MTMLWSRREHWIVRYTLRKPDEPDKVVEKAREVRLFSGCPSVGMTDQMMAEARARMVSQEREEAAAHAKRYDGELKWFQAKGRHSEPGGSHGFMYVNG